VSLAHCHEAVNWELKEGRLAVPALVLPCYDGAASSPLLDGERDHVPVPGVKYHSRC